MPEAINHRKHSHNYPFLGIVVIIFLGLLVYSNSLKNGFVYDDELVIVENPFLNSLKNIKYFFTREYFPGSGEFTYRPMLTLTYLLDYHFWKENPFGYHLTNVIIHVLNATLFYFFLLLLLPFLGKGKAKHGIALLAGIFFVLHPVQTQAVNAVGFRDDPLFFLFFLLSFIFYLRAKKKGVKLFYLASLFCYLLSLLSKESAVLLIFFILLTDFFGSATMYLFSTLSYLANFFIGRYAAIIFALPFLREFYKSEKRTKKMIIYGGYFSVTLLYLYTITFLVTKPIRLAPMNAAPFLAFLPLLVSILNLCIKFILYLKLLILPLRLSVEYAVTPIESFFSPVGLFSFLAIALVFTALILAIRKKRILAFFGLWVFVPLGMVMGGFLPVSEHYLYFSCAGFCVILAIILYDAFLHGSKKIKILGVSFIMLTVIFYYWRTFTRNFIWKDALTFWQERIKLGPATERAHSSLGDAYFRKGLYDKAEEQYLRSLQIDPDYVYARCNLGTTYFNNGLYDKAEVEYIKVLEKDPLNLKALNNLGMIYFNKGLADKAEKNFQEAIKANHFNIEAHINLGNLYSGKKVFNKAEEQFKEAIRINPGFALAHYNLGNIYFNQGLYEKAVWHYEAAIGLSPRLIEAYNNLGASYFKAGRYVEAERSWKKILEFDPDNQAAQENLKALQTPAQPYLPQQ
ncbi:MAG: tetratricopeptide repeat protein [Candidatus Omnitrophota bacterium]